MAVQKVEQDDLTSSNSINIGDVVADEIASLAENGNEPRAQLPPKEESSETPASESLEAACIDSLLEQTRELSPEPEPIKPKVSLCGICNEKPGKYKCARCYLP